MGKAAIECIVNKYKEVLTKFFHSNNHQESINLHVTGLRCRSKVQCRTKKARISRKKIPRLAPPPLPVRVPVRTPLAITRGMRKRGNRKEQQKRKGEKLKGERKRKEREKKVGRRSKNLTRGERWVIIVQDRTNN